MRLDLDHLAVSCASLAEGVAHVEALLGVPMTGGGRHATMGTHNRLLSLGPGEYLEVIAIDPEAAAPGRPRWFGLDGFAGHPRLTNWICRCGDLDAALLHLAPEAGAATAMARGDYRWRIGLTGAGAHAWDNLHPGLIQWDGPHPADALPDSGCRLTRLTVSHPDAGALRDRLGLDDPRLHFRSGVPGIAAVIDTQRGERVLA